MRAQVKRINQEVLVASFSEQEVCRILAAEAAKAAGFSINETSKYTINFVKKDRSSLTGYEMFADIKVVNDFCVEEAK